MATEYFVEALISITTNEVRGHLATGFGMGYMHARIATAFFICNK